MKVAVVIPVHGTPSQLNDLEISSIRQIATILKKYHISIVAPYGYDSNHFMERTRLTIEIDWVYFDSYYFESVYTYSNLLVEAQFYQRFKTYKYILITQPDAWVFRDELVMWCSKGYDYIGAPWFEGWNHGTGNYKTIGVGNGGFSLRNVRTALKVIQRLYYLRKFQSGWNKLHLFKLFSFEKVVGLLQKPLRIKDVALLLEAIKPITKFEDYYWTEIAGAAFHDFRTAPIDDAMLFSFEVNPSYLYELNNRKLPFGCHAWEKYEPEFWQQFINERNTEETNELS
ncbi:hypothetical protein ESA94_21100 [Lacibacter luteus]|uniref:DUF5672 domain-containing protein n=1 Tax=Lacibacter luteus TaxID=2508719 RepID=A0A4Q1CD66_9BACT|nr:DUF5672 family protein [Lacibacter luteus]RXK57432.1 hypothetical protein ESA94_21100 [Lacibacter luteus]